MHFYTLNIFAIMLIFWHSNICSTDKNHTSGDLEVDLMMLFCYRFFEIKCLNVLDNCVVHKRTGIDFVLGSEDPQSSNSKEGNGMSVVANLGFFIVS